MASIVPGDAKQRLFRGARQDVVSGLDVWENSAVDRANEEFARRSAQRAAVDDYWRAVQQEYGGNIGLTEDALHGGLRPVYPELWAADVAGAAALGKLAVKGGANLARRTLVPLAERTVVPVAKGAYREVSGIIRHLRGRSPEVVLPVGPRGFAAAKASGQSVEALDLTRTRLPGETGPMWFVKTPLSAQGRSVLRADNTMLDDAYTWLRKQFRTSRQGVPVEQLLVKSSPQTKILKSAYPNGLRDSEVFLETPDFSGSVVTLGSATKDALRPRITITDFRTPRLAAGRRGVFSHEFKHTLESREPTFVVSNRGLTTPIGEDAQLDPAVLENARLRSAAIPYGENYPDQYGKLLDELMYTTQVHENSARFVEGMSNLGTTDVGAVYRKFKPVGSPERRIGLIPEGETDPYEILYTDRDLLQTGRSPTFTADTNVHLTAKGGDTRADAKGGDSPGSETAVSEPQVSEPQVSEPAPQDQGGPRIVINPSTFRNKKDAACVMWNEGFRIAMEDMGFEPVSEPTDEQRRFFSDTAYADDELQMRRTILARICTFDTSVRRPTDEQLQEAVEFLENVMEAGYPQNEWEQSAVQRMHDMISQVPMGQQEEQPPEEQPPEEQPPEEQPPEEQPPEEQADMLGGETFDDKVKLTGVRAPGTGRPEDVDAAEEAAHDELLAQREEESTDDSTRYERLELGGPEAEANNPAPAQAAPAQAAPAQAAPAQAPAEWSFVQLPAFAVADDDSNRSAFREVLNTPIGTPLADVKKAPGTPGAWQGGRYGVKKDEPGLPNSWKGGRY